jgi:hypothetical protein
MPERSEGTKRRPAPLSQRRERPVPGTRGRKYEKKYPKQRNPAKHSDTSVRQGRKGEEGDGSRSKRGGGPMQVNEGDGQELEQQKVVGLGLARTGRLKERVGWQHSTYSTAVKYGQRGGRRV